MRRYLMVGVCILILGLGACTSIPPQPFASPIPAKPAGNGAQIYLPIFRAPKLAWTLPAQGYSSAIEEQVAGQPARTLLSGWWYDWTPRCQDRYQVPMVWTAAYMSAASLRACNDGRSLLILNEPERTDQANTSPEQAADLVYDLAGWWQGPLWCCGTNASATTWVAAFKRSYEQRYGPLPLAGWAVHAYTNDSLAPGQNFGGVVEPWRVEVVMAHVDAFHQQFPGPVVVSELGVLTGDWWHTSQQVAPVATAFRASLARREYIVGYAWFVAFAHQFSPANLLDARGQLTPVGLAWTRRREPMRINH